MPSPVSSVSTVTFASTEDVLRFFLGILREWQSQPWRPQEPPALSLMQSKLNAVTGEWKNHAITVGFRLTRLIDFPISDWLGVTLEVYKSQPRTLPVSVEEYDDPSMVEKAKSREIGFAWVDCRETSSGQVSHSEKLLALLEQLDECTRRFPLSDVLLLLETFVAASSTASIGGFRAIGVVARKTSAGTWEFSPISARGVHELDLLCMKRQADGWVVVGKLAFEMQDVPSFAGVSP